MALSSPLVLDRPLRGLSGPPPPEVYDSVQLIIALIESITLLRQSEYSDLRGLKISLTAL